MQNQFVIIVAGGTGSRMNSNIPKQFIELSGTPVIIKTIRCFLDYNPAMQIVICVHRDYEAYLRDLLLKFGLQNTKTQITLGGNTRFDSVKNGLALLPDEDAVVGIHDAARPFVSLPTIKNCFEVAREKGNAVPCISINESLRKASGESSMAVKRDEYKIVQTPQCFLINNIKKAFAQNYTPAFTDDATVLESVGGKINLVEGNRENIKITTAYDLRIATTFYDHE